MDTTNGHDVAGDDDDSDSDGEGDGDGAVVAAAGDTSEMPFAAQTEAGGEEKTQPRPQYHLLYVSTTTPPLLIACVCAITTRGPRSPRRSFVPPYVFRRFAGPLTTRRCRGECSFA